MVSEVRWREHGSAGLATRAAVLSVGTLKFNNDAGDGFYYALDRATGEFLVGKQFARQTWAMGLDEKGRPIQNPETIPSEQGALVYPDDDGAANWYSPA